MRSTFTRQELYDFVWSEPMQRLAARFRLSDVGLAKACKKVDIPRPPRGYWAKLSAGKKVEKVPLPARGLGMSNKVTIGGGPYAKHQPIPDEDILSMQPEPPRFDEGIESVIARVEKMVGRVPMPKFPDMAHRALHKILRDEEERRQKVLASEHVFSWDEPRFDEPIEQRRLRIINAIMTALSKHGFGSEVRGRYARELSATINDTRVSFMLDATSQRERASYQATTGTRGSAKDLEFEILNGDHYPNIRYRCVDSKSDLIEKHLKEIVVEIIVAGERRYREGEQRRYEWVLERKERIREERRQQQEATEREERERIEALHQARVDRLMADATSLRLANDIRAYVADVEARSVGNETVSHVELEAWKQWALAEADRIDPVKSRRFLGSIEDLDSMDQAEES